MEPSSSYRSVSCPHCKKLIPFPNFDLHEAQCLRQMNRNPPPQQPSNSQPIIQSSFPSFAAPATEDKYICPDCQMELPITSLGIHEAECEQRSIQCLDCRFSFPNSLFAIHKNECTSRNPRIEEGKEDYLPSFNQNINEPQSRSQYFSAENAAQPQSTSSNENISQPQPENFSFFSKSQYSYNGTFRS